MIAVGEEAWGSLLELAGRFFFPFITRDKMFFSRVNEIRQDKDGVNIFPVVERENNVTIVHLSPECCYLGTVCAENIVLWSPGESVRGLSTHTHGLGEKCRLQL